uniref:ATP synthase F0 subunit 6 n=1 Tax=Lingula reevii TaxID=2792136 RepID=UPI002E7A2611|nr:ATP synthase F0 subunit 6 [Lingula reevii]WQG15352.1 ATP synthase F0 subunit 6 [Lingula reevii]
MNFRSDLSPLLLSSKGHYLFTNFYYDGWFGVVLVLVTMWLFVPLFKPCGVWMSGFQSAFKALHQFSMAQCAMYVPCGGKGLGSYFSGIFIILIVFNLVGLVPLGVAYSAHLFMTLPLALVTWASLVVKGFWNRRLFSSSEFLSSSIPRYLAIPFACIEILSHIIRPLTLSARLSINVMAGHMLYKSVLAWAGKLATAGAYYKAGLVFSAAMGCFAAELCICFIQAFVFFILLNVYCEQYSKPQA